MLPEGIPKIACPNNSTWLPPRKMAEADHSSSAQLDPCASAEHSSIQARLRQHTLWITSSSAAPRRLTFHQESLKHAMPRPGLVGRRRNALTRAICEHSYCPMFASAEMSDGTQ